ncbi:MAG: Gfo/Idh/MocA family oxidoreductase [Candidatus Nitrohelix vancouverensis]|uniref:Gfo/Idh/MocA family oxidoreductase n=1 Tax=Candidatus Nitrohelix vancouverensis TaxID=2705534 RepID=A0A7T0G3F0_9BACT|nr:MAG: Gfo/Idh/MocA family oxidoreductase [Candidatus Nitrohelix vancouverensis]
MNETVNLALVGAGYWGKNLARNFSTLGVLRLVCDPSEAARNDALSKGIETTESFASVLSRDDIHAIVIATPAVMHHSMVRDALLAGKHVFVEKPLALNAEEGEELARLATERQRVLFVGHILHYHPAILRLKTMVANGELGKLQYIYSNRLNLGKIRREENILWSFAPHDISLILSLVNEEPESVQAMGSNILHPEIADATLTHLRFASGVAAHIFVSWLNPFKEQKLVVTGDQQMAVFDDTAALENKLVVYPHQIHWKAGTPISEKKEGRAIDLTSQWEEPLLAECRAFLDAITHGKTFYTDGAEGVKTLRVLERAQNSLTAPPSIPKPQEKNYFLHETSSVEEDCSIGERTKIWRFSHILSGVSIGEACNIGQNVVIGPNVSIGNNVKIQNNVSLYEGVTLEDDVFCGPSCVFTNVINPRSAIPRKDQFQETRVMKGATIGANATIRCGITIGSNAFIGMGAVVLEDVPDQALVYGNPGKIQGWVCQCGCTLDASHFCASCNKQARLPQIN